MGLGESSYGSRPDSQSPHPVASDAMDVDQISHKNPSTVADQPSVVSPLFQPDPSMPVPAPDLPVASSKALGAIKLCGPTGLVDCKSSINPMPRRNFHGRLKSNLCLI